VEEGGLGEQVIKKTHQKLRKWTSERFAEKQKLDKMHALSQICTTKM